MESSEKIMNHKTGTAIAELPPVLSPGLVATVRAQYRLAWEGIHGVAHWSRVLWNGMLLAEILGAHKDVVALFALFHDACRINDRVDDGHGSRGAQLARLLCGKCFDLEKDKLELLVIACELHTRGFTLAEPTVQACWDADRLDLWRVGIRPKEKRLCTEYARQPKVIKACSLAVDEGRFPLREFWDSGLDSSPGQKAGCSANHNG